MCFRLQVHEFSQLLFVTKATASPSCTHQLNCCAHHACPALRYCAQLQVDCYPYRSYISCVLPVFSSLRLHDQYSAIAVRCIHHFASPSDTHQFNFLRTHTRPRLALLCSPPISVSNIAISSCFQSCVAARIQPIVCRCGSALLAWR